MPRLLSLPSPGVFSERTKVLEARQTEYKITDKEGFTRLDIPDVTHLNIRDRGGSVWTTAVFDLLAKINTNSVGVCNETGWTFEKREKYLSDWKILPNALYAAAHGVSELFNYYNPDLGPVLPHGRPQSVTQYGQLFASNFPGFPSIAEHFRQADINEAQFFREDDIAFARYFVAGPNPIMLRRLNNFSDFGMSVKRINLEGIPGFESDDLEACLNEGRLFFVSYDIFNGVETGFHPQPGEKIKKHIYQPIVLLGRPNGSRNLLPMAIQCQQNSTDFPLFTPKDAWAWQMAKTTVRVADNCYHTILNHLAFTHLLLEPIVVCSRRHLAEVHPVYALLESHFWGTLSINSIGFTRLVQPNEAIDRLVAIDQPAFMDLMAKERLNYSFEDNYLPKRLARQSIGSDVEYPYAEDALKLWNAIRTWVGSYVSIYYSDDSAVEHDQELAGWGREIDQLGKIKDFGAQGSITSKEELSDILTMIIFTAGPQHAAVNFPQKEMMGFCPIAPLAGYQPAPKDAEKTKADWLAMLPPLDVAMRQLQVGAFLGGAKVFDFGSYQSTYGCYLTRACTSLAELDDRISGPLSEFKRALEAIESEIDIVNNDSQKRLRPYIYLKPSNIPQSINI